MGEACVREAVRQAAQRLDDAGVPSPQHDARALAAWVLGVEDGLLPAVSFTPQQAHRFAELVAQRQARVPLQHLTGQAYFRYLRLQVGPGVFIPRPETEVVAGAAIEYAQRLAAAGQTPVVVDLATGSAAIALAVATEVPRAHVHGVELDSEAFAWAQRNAQAFPQANLHLYQGDLATALPELNGLVDVVVSNPPYIPTTATVRDLEVAHHDPALALWSGPDGLDAIRAVQRTASRLLRPGGLVVVEHADAQADCAPEVFSASSAWVEVRDHLDLAGRPRYLTARKGRLEAA